MYSTIVSSFHIHNIIMESISQHWATGHCWVYANGRRLKWDFFVVALMSVSWRCAWYFMKISKFYEIDKVFSSFYFNVTHRTILDVLKFFSSIISSTIHSNFNVWYCLGYCQGIFCFNIIFSFYFWWNCCKAMILKIYKFAIAFTCSASTLIDSASQF